MDVGGLVESEVTIIDGGCIVIVDGVKGYVWVKGFGDGVRCVLGRRGSWVDVISGDGVVVKRRIIEGDLFVVIGDVGGMFANGVGGLVSKVRKGLKGGRSVGLESGEGVVVGFGGGSGKKKVGGWRSRREDQRVVKKEVVGGDPLNSRSDFGYRNLGGLMGELGRKGEGEGRKDEGDDKVVREIGEGSGKMFQGERRSTVAASEKKKGLKGLNSGGSFLSRRNTDVGRTESVKLKTGGEEKIKNNDEGAAQLGRKKSFLARRSTFFGRAKMPGRSRGHKKESESDLNGRGGKEFTAGSSTITGPRRESTAMARGPRMSEAAPRGANGKKRLVRSKTLRKIWGGSKKQAGPSGTTSRTPESAKYNGGTEPAKEGMRKSLPRATTLFFKPKKS